MLVGRSPTFAFWRSKVGYQAYTKICTNLIECGQYVIMAHIWIIAHTCLSDGYKSMGIGDLLPKREGLYTAH